MRIDFHSHCLPGVDHGCQTLEESLRVLKKAKEEGVDVIIATHHFCPGKDDIDEFLRKRNAAAELVRNAGGEDIPEIMLGAEVYMSSSFAEFSRKAELCIEGSDYMLIEMPYDYWMPWVKDAVWRLVYEEEIQPIMAHIERYRPLRKNIDKLNAYEDMGVAKQVNAYSLFSFGNKRFVRGLLEQGRIDCFGSDIHDDRYDGAMFTKAYEYAGKKYDIRRLNRFARAFYNDIAKKKQ